MSETSGGSNPTVKSDSHSNRPSGQSLALKNFAINYKTAVSASIASLASTTVGFPLDSVKTRMQAYKYSSIPQCVWDTHKNEGIRGFFRGLTVPLFSITLVRTTSFSIYEMTKRFYGNLLRHPLYYPPPQPRKPYQSAYVTSPPYQGFFALNAGNAFLAGFTSGAFITAMACPFEFTKLATQIELLMRRTKFASSPDPTVSTAALQEAKGPMQMAKEIYKTRGFLGLYSGFNYHFARDAVGTGIYFSAYESTKYLLTGTLIPGPLTYALSGASCGIVAWCIVFPIDTAKSIVQRDILMHAPGEVYKRRNPFDFNWFSRRMYRGMTVSIVRSALVNAINFTVYESLRKEISTW